MASLVFTFTGPDRPGLVNALTQEIARHDGSWLESRLAGLAGHFAGIVLVEVPSARRAELAGALSRLSSGGLRVSVEDGEEDTPDQPPALMHLDLVGHDRPGILRDITQALARHGVNIEELTSHVRKASFSAETLFEARARLQVPARLDHAALQKELEDLAREIMVDIEFGAEADAGAASPGSHGAK
jgi:glycine cleavage system regulatory protein